MLSKPIEQCLDLEGMNKKRGEARQVMKVGRLQ